MGGDVRGEEGNGGGEPHLGAIRLAVLRQPGLAVLVVHLALLLVRQALARREAFLPFLAPAPVRAIVHENIYEALER